MGRDWGVKINLYNCDAATRSTPSFGDDLVMVLGFWDDSGAPRPKGPQGTLSGGLGGGTCGKRGSCVLEPTKTQNQTGTSTMDPVRTPRALHEIQGGSHHTTKPTSQSTPKDPAPGGPQQPRQQQQHSQPAASPKRNTRFGFKKGFGLETWSLHLFLGGGNHFRN